MKILKLTTLLDFGGQEKQFISFTEKPELLHHDYIFAAIGYGGNAERILRDRGFEVHILNRNFSIRNLFNIWTIYKLIKKIKPDIVHTAAAEANFHGIIAAKLAGIKYIIGEEIGVPGHSLPAQKVFGWVYRLAHKVVCVSKSVREYLVGIGEIPYAKGVVLYNPVSEPQGFDIQKNIEFSIVYVGRLEKVKNVETLIKAFSKIKNSDTKLCVVGDGREKLSLENFTSELGISSRVEFVGFSPYPSRYVSTADLFVLPSYSEGFGIAAVEAMFLKIPVLATNVGGIPEFITHGENGWLFDPTNIDDLVLSLNEIISLPKEKRIEVGINGYNEVFKNFTVEKYISDLEFIYEQ